jgi:hypothetical protein
MNKTAGMYPTVIQCPTCSTKHYEVVPHDCAKVLQERLAILEDTLAILSQHPDMAEKVNRARYHAAVGLISERESWPLD